MSRKVLIGVAWPYVNGDIHVGHLGGYLLPADIIARFHRLQGEDVLMVSGSDCYGTPITVEADKKGLKPQEVVGMYHIKDLELFKLYNLNYNFYTKTTTPEHKKVVHEVFLNLLKNGYIEKDIMQQYYSLDDKQFLPDRYVEGTCPYCNAENQRSDQCENCGRWLKDGELINPVSKLTGSKIELRDTEHYFLNFKKLEPELKKYLDTNKDSWKNWIWQEADGWLREGLQKRAITRDMDWSMELPVEEIKKLSPELQLSDFTGKRIYVWFEAVIGYLSAVRSWTGMKPGAEDSIYYQQEGQSKNWQDWWQNPDALIYNFMGQDNLVFHTLMWPGELIGLGQGYSLPRYVVVNKFLNYEGKKFSKSRNWTIDSKKIADKYGVDLVRYYIARTLPENKEGNFTWEDFVSAINNELVANLGNLVNRMMSFTKNKRGGFVKLENFKPDKTLEQIGPRLFSKMSAFLFYEGKQKKYEDIKYDSTWLTMEQYERIRKFAGIQNGSNGPWIVRGLDTFMGYSMIANQYFDAMKVWEINKDDSKQEKVDEILLNLFNVIYDLAYMFYPYMPDSAGKLLRMLDKEIVKPEVGRNQWISVFDKNADRKLIKEIEINKVELLFQKLDLKTVLEEKEG